MRRSHHPVSSCCARRGAWSPLLSAVELLDHRVILCLILWGTAVQFSIGLDNFISHSIICESSDFYIPRPTCAHPFFSFMIQFIPGGNKAKHDDISGKSEDTRFLREPRAIAGGLGKSIFQARISKMVVYIGQYFVNETHICEFDVTSIMFMWWSQVHVPRLVLGTSDGRRDPCGCLSVCGYVIG